MCNSRDQQYFVDELIHITNVREFIMKNLSSYAVTASDCVRQGIFHMHAVKLGIP